MRGKFIHSFKNVQLNDCLDTTRSKLCVFMYNVYLLQHNVMQYKDTALQLYMRTQKQPETEDSSMLSVYLQYSVN